MNISSAKLVYFSPTQTTKKIIEAIAQGVQVATAEHIDLTHPGAKMQKFADMHEELAIIGSPVYVGRLPIDMVSRFRRLRGNDTPAVIVVVYGNRAYEDALRELRDLAMETGYRTVAAGAFIGEHSYSNKATPIGSGRPDREDLRRAKEFGTAIQEKVRSMRALEEILPLQVPGNFPYKEQQGLSNVSPVTQETVCAQCGECASVCPVAAIRVGEEVATDRSVCIRCCACVKACSTGARTMEDPRIRQVAEQLSMNCRTRKEPETYL